MFPNQQVRSKDDVFAYAVLTVRVHSKEIEIGAELFDQLQLASRMM